MDTSQDAEPRSGGQQSTPAMQTRGSELRRVDFSGTIWFAAALVATTILMAGLLAAGWRVTSLPRPAQFAWWGSALASFAGLGCLAWAGCPVLGRDLRQADHNKSLTVRAGVILILIGLAVSVTVVLSQPR